MTPIRVLQVVPAMDMGGLETFIMNVYRHIDRSRVQFDFLYHYTHPCVYDDEIAALGGRIFRLSVREDNRIFQYIRQLYAFFAQHPELTILHGHYTGFAVFYNHAAKKHGVPVRIVHSHNTQTEKSLTGLLDRGLSAFCRRDATHLFACGQQAGQALFGVRPFRLFPNGIELARFAPNAQAAAACRAAWGLPPDAVVYGHIGRFTQQKNHAFLLDIFAELYKRQPAARLLLAGAGPLEDEARAKAARLGIMPAVVFAGLQTDTPALYSAMDGFLLPSLFEGFPVVLVEAQAAGLPCFVSDTVSPEAALTPGYHTLPLAQSAAYWAQAIITADLTRQDNTARLAAAGFDIATTASALCDFYLTCASST